MMRVGEVAAFTGLGNSTIRRALERREMRFWITPGGHYRVSDADVIQWMNKRLLRDYEPVDNGKHAAMGGTPAPEPGNEEVGHD